MNYIVFPIVNVALAGAAVLLATVTAVAEQPDQASRTMIESQLKTQLSVPGSLSIMYVDATKPNDKGLQTACGWFIARGIGGEMQAPKAFAMSYFTSAQLAKIHSIGENTVQVQTIKAFCNELGIDF
ncbi:MAG: hypothetical protein U1E67_03010 [Hyphomicrobiales bacterium]